MKHYKISTGIGEGFTRITSFDDALLASGVGNYNLVRLSSILPLDAIKKDDIVLPFGSLLPIAYAVEHTNVEGEMIASAIAIGFPILEDDEHCCVIMEYEGKCSQEEAAKIVCDMIREGFYKRHWALDRIECQSVDAICHGRYTTTFACVAEWEE